MRSVNVPPVSTIAAVLRRSRRPRWGWWIVLTAARFSQPGSERKRCAGSARNKKPPTVARSGLQQIRQPGQAAADSVDLLGFSLFSLFSLFVLVALAVELSALVSEASLPALPVVLPLSLRP